MGYILMNVGVNNRASTINQIFVGVNNIARLVYQGGGGSGDFQLPTFTGSSSIFGDETSGRIELYESGTLVLFPGTYDIFAVGGGSSGCSHNGGGAGGGGGGYTKTVSGITVPSCTEYNVVVGDGGAGLLSNVYDVINYNAGGVTSVTQSSTSSPMISANGASGTGSGTINSGVNGGSGGGAGGNDNPSGDGGSDGSPGENSDGGTGGTGQGTTTRAFGDENGTLYAAGGGGNQTTMGYTPGYGGEGGGGNGSVFRGTGATSATPNSGSGGGGAGDDAGVTHRASGSGGSGIVIVRWNNGGATIAQP